MVNRINSFDKPSAASIPEEKKIDEILQLFHKRSPEFLGDSAYVYYMAKQLTPEQAEAEIPLYLQFLIANPIETLNEPQFWVGLRENLAIHDNYIAASLASTRLSKHEQLVTILCSAYHFKIPGLVQKVLSHPELTPLEDLFEELFLYGTTEQVNAALDRFGTASVTPYLRSLMMSLPPDLQKLRELMKLLQDRGVNIKTYILQKPQKLLVHYPWLLFIDYFLNFLSTEEESKVLDLTTCQSILFKSVLTGKDPLQDLKDLLSYFEEKKLPLRDIVLECKKAKKPLIERLIAEGQQEAAELLQRYVEPVSIEK